MTSQNVNVAADRQREMVRQSIINNTVSAARERLWAGAAIEEVVSILADGADRLDRLDRSAPTTTKD